MKARLVVENSLGRWTSDWQDHREDGFLPHLVKNAESFLSIRVNETPVIFKERILAQSVITIETKEDDG